jgi:predicted dehydrogenase
MALSAASLNSWPLTGLWHGWPTLEQALQDTAVDLVVIATPNDLHFQQAQAALLAGKHVVVDKPFTVTVSEARQLDALASKQGLLLSVFHNRRWDADFLTLQQVLQSGRLGQISQFASHFDRYRPEVRQRWREQGGPAAVCGTTWAARAGSGLAVVRTTARRQCVSGRTAPGCQGN